MIMTKREYSIAYLKAIEKKNKDYFKLIKTDILDCVCLSGEKSISVHIIKKDLPFEIKYEIESMFWK